MRRKKAHSAKKTHRVHHKAPPAHQVVHRPRRVIDQISWEAPDFHLHPHGWAWNLLIVVASFGVAFLFYLYQQYVLALIVALAGIVMVLGTRDKPATVTHAVTPRGFQTGKVFLPWTEIKSFWIVTVPEGNTAVLAHKLHLETLQRGSPVLTVYLGEVNPASVRTALGHYLPEHTTRGEQFTDILARLLRV